MVVVTVTEMGTSSPSPDADMRGAGLGHWVSNRRWPLVLTVVMAVFGMAFLVGWDPEVHHVEGWFVPGDVWGIFRGAHYIGWGYVGGIYTPGSGVVTFPGICILLTPIALMSTHFRWTESYPPYANAYPSAAFALMFFEMLLAASALFAADTLAQLLGVARGRRIALCVVLAVTIWPLVAVWGHAEDALSVTFALYALVEAIRGRWSRTGWLMAIGILVQPLVLLMVPLLFAVSPARQRVPLIIRCASLSVVVMAFAFGGNWSGTYRAVVVQPTPPALNHPTPWLILAPVVAGAGRATVPIGAGVGPRHVPPSVSAGDSRLLDLVLALGIGLMAWRRRPSPAKLIWWSALALSLRCIFEPVMTPYYLVPPLILALLASAENGLRRFVVAVTATVALTLVSYQRLGEWEWWLPVTGLLLVVLACGYPVEEDGAGEDPIGVTTPSVVGLTAADEAI